MAREEYDKELAARRELESQMEILRLKFTEQALRLASVDKGRKQTDELDRQSRELRMSVVATEKQLSQLRAEVELSTAQIEELANVDKCVFRFCFEPREMVSDSVMTETATSRRRKVFIHEVTLSSRSSPTGSRRSKTSIVTKLSGLFSSGTN